MQTFSGLPREGLDWVNYPLHGVIGSFARSATHLRLRLLVIRHACSAAQSCIGAPGGSDIVVQIIVSMMSSSLM